MHKNFDLNVDLHSVDENYGAPPTVQRSHVKRHATLMSNFLLVFTKLLVFKTWIIRRKLGFI